MTGEEVYTVKFLKSLNKLVKAIGKNPKYRDDVTIINKVAFLPKKELYPIIVTNHITRRDEILSEVSKYLQIPIEDIPVRCKKKDLVFARYLYMYAAKEFTILSLEKIGDLVGRKHSDVIHAINSGIPSFTTGSGQAEYKKRVFTFMEYLRQKYEPSEVGTEAGVFSEESNQQSGNTLPPSVLPSQVQSSQTES